MGKINELFYFATLGPFPRLQPPCLTGPLLGPWGHPEGRPPKMGNFAEDVRFAEDVLAERLRKWGICREPGARVLRRGLRTTEANVLVFAEAKRRGQRPPRRKEGGRRGGLPRNTVDPAGHGVPHWRPAPTTVFVRNSKAKKQIFRGQKQAQKRHAV